MAGSKHVMELVLSARNALAAPLRAAQTALGGLKGSFLAVAVPIAAAVAAVAAWVKILGETKQVIQESVKQVAALGDEIQKTSQRLGVAAEDLSALRFAAERSGASAQSITTAYRTLARAATEAADGAAEYADVFDALGVSVTDNSEKLKDLDTLFMEIADSVGGMKSETEVLGLAQQVLGRGATDLMVLLKEQRDGIQGLKDEAKALGGVIGTDLANASAAYADSQTNLQFAIQGVRNEIARDFLPILTEAGNDIAEWVGENREMIGGMAGKIADSFSKMIEVIVPFIETHGPGVIAVLGGVATVSAQIAEAMVAAANATVRAGGKTLDFYYGTGEAAEKAEEKTTGLVAALARLREGTAHPDTPLFQSWELSPEQQHALAAINEQLAELSVRLAELDRAKPLALKEPFAGPETFRELPAWLDLKPEDMLPSGPAAPEDLGFLPSLDMVAEYFEDFQDIYGAEFETFLRDSFDEFRGVEDPIGMVRIQHQVIETRKLVQGFVTRAKEAFVTEFAQSVGFAINNLSRVAAYALRTGKDATEQFKQVWGSFVDYAISALLRLIAKLAIAAALSALLPGNFANVSKALDFLKLAGMQKGGIVGGGGRGDKELRLLDPREYVIRPEAVSYYGTDLLDAINAARAPIAGLPSRAAYSSPIDREALAQAYRGGLGVERIEVHTILGTEEEGRAVARGIFQYAMQEGYL